MLGPLRCDSSAAFGRRDRAVLTALATCVGRALSPDQLADAVWGDALPPSYHKALQGCVVRLRKALGADAIQTSPQGYRLEIPVEEVDSRRFERLVTRGRELLALGEPERAAYLLTQALDLWRGRAFEDVEAWDQAMIEAARLDELRLEAEELRVHACLRTGRHLEVLAAAEGMVKAAPMREGRWTLLALAQYQAGRQTEALRTIHRIKSLLADEIGLDPSPELASVEQAILRQDESLLIEGPTDPSSACPYRGLTPYDVDDSESFFGRDADLTACLEVLRHRRSLAVVGPSGCGKSSLVRAGVTAALRRDGRKVVLITPGQHPMQALTAMADSGPRPVLVVDQCEEVFSLCSNPEEREEFLTALVRHTQDAPLVLALRADRLAEVSSHPGLARLVERDLHLLGGMTEHELREAIEAPARQAGLLLEPGLIDLLVGEVEGNPGALPLLSHALLETWKRREGKTLTVAGYVATGGIRGAITQSAEHVYSGIDTAQRHMLRDLLLRLVIAGSEGEPVRTRIPRRLLSTDSDHEDLIDRLVATRLVTSDDGVVEMAHEALARAWPRLRAWLDDDVEGQRILHHLSGAADAWNLLGRPDSELYRGVRLTRALEWKADQRTTLTETEVAFLEASDIQDRSERRAAAERARAQARLIHRLRGVVAGAAMLLVAALIAGALAVRQADRADTNAADAADAALAAEARRVGAKALTTQDIDTSLLLAVAGVRLDNSPETQSSLLATVARHPELIASTPMAGESIIYFDVSPDGQTVATYDELNRVRLYDIATGDLLAQFQAGARRQLGWLSTQVKFSPDGRTLAVVMAAPSPQPVMLLDADTLEPQRPQPGGAPRGRRLFLDLAYSSDGSHVAASMVPVQGGGISFRTTSPLVFVWDVADPRRPVAEFVLAGEPGLALNPDGTVLYTSDPLTIHRLETGESVPVPNAEYVGRMAVSPDGRFVAGSGEGGLLLLDASTGKLIRRLPANSDESWFVNFSKEGSRVATVTFDKREAIVWDVATGEVEARLPLEEGGEAFDFAPDGSTLYTAGSTSTLRHWDIDGDRQFIGQVASIPADLGDLSFVRPSPGGDFIVLPMEQQIAFFDVKANKLSRPVDRGDGYLRRADSGSWHPDGVHFALATGGEIRVWDARTAELKSGGRPSGPYVTSLDYSTDGSRLVIGELSGRVTMVDPTTMAPLGRSVRLAESVRRIAAGPDNHTALALTGLEDPSDFWRGSSTHWALVDLESGEVIDKGELGLHGGAVDYSPDGRHAAIGGREGELLVLDLGTGDPLRAPVVIHDDSVVAVTYSADGRQLLTSGFDASNGLWDGETGLPLARVVTPHLVTEAGFGKEPNSVLIAPLFGGFVYEWDTRPGYAVEYACRMAGRSFTKPEWTAEFGDRPYQEVCP